MGKQVWKQGEDGFSIYVEDAGGRIIADVRAPHPPVPANVEDAMEHHRRRARLLAAAPELLSALEGVLAVADRKTQEFDAARAAIAKATVGVASDDWNLTKEEKS